MKNKKQTRTRNARPQVGTIEAAIVPSGSTDRGLSRRIDALGKALLTGKVRPDIARIQIKMWDQQLALMSGERKVVELSIKAAEVQLEREKHVSREAGRLRSAEIQVGTADANGYQAIVRRLNGGNGAGLDS